MSSFYFPKNNALGSLASQLASNGTVMTMNDGHTLSTASFPYPVTIDLEILKVTGTSSGTNSFAVTRAQENTLAAAHGSASAVSNNITAAYLSEIQTALLTGWVPFVETLTYASADDPIFTLTIPGDKTDVLTPGTRLKITQDGGTKYFIVHAVSYSAPNTTVTVYGGTDYDLTSNPITNPSFSGMKSPVGFPMNPNFWTVEVEDANSYTQNNPTQNQWYNFFQITIPIGSWFVNYQINMYVVKPATSVGMFSTLSNANNSESDASWTSCIAVGGASGTLIIQGHGNRRGTIIRTSKLALYLNLMTNGSAVTSISSYGVGSPTIITAIDAYL